MDWEKLGIGAAIGAAILKIAEAVGSYLSDKFWPTKREEIEREKSAFDLYNELIIKFNELQNDLINTREECFQKHYKFEEKILHMQCQLDSSMKKEKDCLIRLEKLQDKIKQYETVLLNISAEVKSSKNEIRSLRDSAGDK